MDVRCPRCDIILTELEADQLVTIYKGLKMLVTGDAVVYVVCRKCGRMIVVPIKQEVANGGS